MNAMLMKLGLASAAGTLFLCPCRTTTIDATAPVVAVVAADTATVHFAIEGMTCGSCATTARLVLRRIDGVYDATVSHDSATAVVRYDPARTDPEAMIERLRAMTGYEARVEETPRG